MADEIAQVCEMELNGVKMVFKASLEVAAFMARAIKAMFNFGVKTKGKIDDSKLKEPGKKDIRDIFKLSEGAPPQALDIREVDIDEVIRVATSKGLHYCECVDFTPNDGLVPLMIPAQEAAVWGQIYKAVASMRLDEDKQSVNDYGHQIAEEEEKLLSCTDPKEKEKIETKIENLKQAKDEVQQWVDYGEDVVNGEKVTDSFQEFLKKSEGTDFEKNPEVAMAEYEKGVEIGAKFSISESFQPVRDKNYMPNSKVMFYVPNIGAIVTREFKQDDIGLVYSNYSVKTQNGEIYTCSDKDMTKEKWNSTELPKLMDKAGVLEETQCRAFKTEEKLQAYLQYHGKVKSPAEENIEKRLKEGKEVFSSAEAKAEVLNAVSEQKKGFASANVTGTDVDIICDPEMLVRENGKLCMILSDDERLEFSSTKNEGIVNGKAKFTIDEKSKPTFVKRTKRAVTNIFITPEEAQSKIKEVMGEGIANTASHVRSATKR